MKVFKLHRFLMAVNVFKELLLQTFALGCKVDQRLKNEQIYFVRQLAGKILKLRTFTKSK